MSSFNLKPSGQFRLIGMLILLLFFVVAIFGQVSPEAASKNRGERSPFALLRRRLDTRLEQFPLPREANAYLLGPRREYQYGLPPYMRALELSTYRVKKQLGASQWPPVICDWSNAQGKTPSGRHPKGAHNSGTNVDSGYYLDNPKNGLYVCNDVRDDHANEWPKYLDAPRTALLFASLAEFDLQCYEKIRKFCVWLIAVDGRIVEPIHQAIDKLVKDCIITKQVGDHTKRLVYGELRDEGTGWFQFHHNHFHLRFHPLPNRVEEAVKAIERSFENPQN